MTNEASEQNGSTNIESRPNRNNWKEGHAKKKKMTYQEQKDFETIESDITALEEKLEQLEEQMIQASSDFVKLNQLTQEKEETQSVLDEKMERWIYLEELASELGISD